mmetsp:Transcript_5839/g.10633  ORF Transcript_5839/g.10633 Transcript_5839/m.10633 type:complete len:399 (+) Transcript_5839:4101-5297(+)
MHLVEQERVKLGELLGRAPSDGLDGTCIFILLVHLSELMLPLEEAAVLPSGGKEIMAALGETGARNWAAVALEGEVKLSAFGAGVVVQPDPPELISTGHHIGVGVNVDGCDLATLGVLPQAGHLPADGAGRSAPVLLSHGRLGVIPELVPEANVEVSIVALDDSGVRGEVHVRHRSRVASAHSRAGVALDGVVEVNVGVSRADSQHLAVGRVLAARDGLLAVLEGGLHFKVQVEDGTASVVEAQTKVLALFGGEGEGGPGVGELPDVDQGLAAHTPDPKGLVGAGRCHDQLLRVGGAARKFFSRMRGDELALVAVLVGLLDFEEVTSAHAENDEVALHAARQDGAVEGRDGIAIGGDRGGLGHIDGASDHLHALTPDAAHSVHGAGDEASRGLAAGEG